MLTFSLFALCICLLCLCLTGKGEGETEYSLHVQMGDTYSCLPASTTLKQISDTVRSSTVGQHVMACQLNIIIIITFFFFVQYWTSGEKLKLYFSCKEKDLAVTS